MSNCYVTFTGFEVHPENLGALHINLQDMAHHLTNIQRFGGALPFDKSYSVAEHCILMAEHAQVYFDYGVARMCLLHDAPEAYLGDVVSGLKACLPDYQALEHELEGLIYSKYNIDTQYAGIVKSIDTCILLDEVRQLIPNRAALFDNLYPNTRALGVRINGDASPYKIKARYLELCRELDIGD